MRKPKRPKQLKRRPRKRVKPASSLKKRKIRRVKTRTASERKKIRVKRKPARRRRSPTARTVQPPPEPAKSAVIREGAVPVVFIHRGDDDYLAHSLQQAKRSSPQSDIVLIGDSDNLKYASETVQHFRIDDYFQSAARFAEVYKHQSGNSYDYELFCFQRWFILKEFVKANGIERCCYLDSDILLYADANHPEFHGFTNVWVMLTFNTASTLEDFCYLIDIYFRNPDLHDYLLAYTQKLGYQGLNDMVFSSLYLEHWPQYKQNLDGIFGESFFDGNIGHPLRIPEIPEEGGGVVEMLDGKKKVYRINGGLYAKAGERRWIKINSLHFQAENKKHMAYFVAPDAHAGDGQICYFDYGSQQWLPS